MQLVCTGLGASAPLTTQTNAAGKFEFENVGGTPYTLNALIGGRTIPVAQNIALGGQPAEIEGVLSLVPDQTGGTTGGTPTVTKIEVETDVDDEDGHHSEHHESDDDSGKSGKS